LEPQVDIWVGASRSLVREVLAREAGIAPAELHIERGENGKPFVPEWPHLYFNLSHSGSLYVCGITHVGPIGVDIEQVRDIPEAEDIRKQYALAAGPFLVAWTRREAYLKARGVGLSGIDEPVRNGWHTETFVPEAGYIGAWCVEGGAVTAKYHKWP
jgi:4'-phosphopantetheinyl transferase